MNISLYDQFQDLLRHSTDQKKARKTVIALLEGYRYIKLHQNMAYKAFHDGINLSYFGNEPCEFSASIDSIEVSVENTRIIITYIDFAIDSYKDFMCNYTNKKTDIINYNIFEDKYLLSYVKSTQELAFQNHVDVSTIRRSLRKSIDQLTNILVSFALKEVGKPKRVRKKFTPESTQLRLDSV